ncbi:hypothetical protein SCO02_21090 [Staphylococcus ureilyticus]|uniref:Uncharacterized protein n=1 Tax=Staphylococcus ureilyticus TaxID=94138 RepID=A0AB34AL87_STAUR|nr:hypothetical protein [Staphylococcus ureilyticus]GEQ03668.1 hypothetical protein SCO02_21090 [Staphylococcus ureilyticus]
MLALFLCVNIKYYTISNKLILISQRSVIDLKRKGELDQGFIMPTMLNVFSYLDLFSSHN